VNTIKILIKYDDSVVSGSLRRIGPHYTYIAQKGGEISKIGTVLSILKAGLTEEEYGEVFLAPDLAEKCHEALLLRIKKDKSFIPDGITVFVSLSGRQYQNIK